MAKPKTKSQIVEHLSAKTDLSKRTVTQFTIHKSHGSEFEAVIIPVATQHFKKSKDTLKCLTNFFYLCSWVTPRS
ncbi:hypothetical protein [Candidatus Manganitrophus noduliformans]|uniref:UvrD-like helicase C-terminal domain-containing protein n=1 Tax=Candidatus Manganitrophus noduliformans TaxID=2606439 RepID=A0A7X6DT64_9BACT|nr:hypothetical protein [Candidatus Manganitrophus noduliformans]NKE72899.1 hypothetical protein [Candidatus Manganitrophus noduliformans]